MSRCAQGIMVFWDKANNWVNNYAVCCLHAVCRRLSMLSPIFLQGVKKVLDSSEKNQRLQNSKFYLHHENILIYFAPPPPPPRPTPQNPLLYRKTGAYRSIHHFFLLLLKNTYCRYSLEPPRRGGSNEYPQSIFWAEIWKISEFLLKLCFWWRNFQ